MKKKRKLKKGPIIFILLIIIAVVAGIYLFNSDKENNNTSTNKDSKSNTNKTSEKDLISKDEEVIRIKQEYDLDFDIPKKYESLFKKYIETVESNTNITKYKKHMYNFFKILMNDNINSYLNEEYFLNRVANLTITVNDAITNTGIGGFYYDGGSPLIELDKDYSSSLYHELVHFLDGSINPGFGEELWLCEGKVYLNHNYEELDESIQGKCKYLVPQKTDLITEAGAELYSAKFFKKGVIAYFDLCAYFTAMEYILGSDTMDSLFLSNNSDYDYMKLMLDNGFTLDEYNEIIADLAYYTYPTDHTNYTPTGKIVDSLIDLYKRNKKDKNWMEDEEFKYILKSFINMGDNDRYKNSKYKNDMDKIVYKSFDDFLKQEKDMFDQIPSDVDFNVTSIPAYIVDNTLYLGTRINGTEDEYAYFKYDFNKKKISDFKYNMVK